MDEFYSRSGPVYYKVRGVHAEAGCAEVADQSADQLVHKAYATLQSYEWYWLTLWSAVGVIINTVVALFLPLWYLGGLTAVRWPTFIFAASFVVIMNGLIQFFIPVMLFNGIFVSDFMYTVISFVAQVVPMVFAPWVLYGQLKGSMHSPYIVHSSIVLSLLVAAVAIIGFVAPLFSRATPLTQVLIRLVVMPIAVEAVVMLSRGVGARYLRAHVPQDTMLVYIGPAVLITATMGRFFTTNMNSTAQTVLVSVITAAVEIFMRLTMVHRDSFYQRVCGRRFCKSGEDPLMDADIPVLAQQPHSSAATPTASGTTLVDLQSISTAHASTNAAALLPQEGGMIDDSLSFDAGKFKGPSTTASGGMSADATFTDPGQDLRISAGKESTSEVPSLGIDSATVSIPTHPGAPQSPVEGGASSAEGNPLASSEQGPPLSDHGYRLTNSNPNSVMSTASHTIGTQASTVGGGLTAPLTVNTTPLPAPPAARTNIASWNTLRMQRVAKNAVNTHSYYSYLLVDTMAEDVGIFASLALTLLFRLPARRGELPIEPTQVVLRVFIQYLLEFMTDIGPALALWVGSHCCGVRLLAVTSKQVAEAVGLPLRDALGGGGKVGDAHAGRGASVALALNASPTMRQSPAARTQAGAGGVVVTEGVDGGQTKPPRKARGVKRLKKPPPKQSKSVCCQVCSRLILRESDADVVAARRASHQAFAARWRQIASDPIWQPMDMRKLLQAALFPVRSAGTATDKVAVDVPDREVDSNSKAAGCGSPGTLLEDAKHTAAGSLQLSPAHQRAASPLGAANVARKGGAGGGAIVMSGARPPSGLGGSLGIADYNLQHKSDSFGADNSMGYSTVMTGEHTTVSLAGSALLKEDSFEFLKELRFSSAGSEDDEDDALQESKGGEGGLAHSRVRSGSSTHSASVSGQDGALHIMAHSGQERVVSLAGTESSVEGGPMPSFVHRMSSTVHVPDAEQRILFARVGSPVDADKDTSETDGGTPKRRVPTTIDELSSLQYAAAWVTLRTELVAVRLSRAWEMRLPWWIPLYILGLLHALNLTSRALVGVGLRCPYVDAQGYWYWNFCEPRDDL